MPHQQVTEDQPRTQGLASSAISTGAVRLLSEHTGRGPTKAQTTISRDSVAIILQDTLTQGERDLVAAGMADTVLRTRHRFQEAMREELIALVEGRVHRKVVAFMSANHIDPDIAVEFFVLEPQENDSGPMGEPAGLSQSRFR
jgi:uncharacterized protein YbcI